MINNSYITPDTPANPFTHGKQQVAIAPISTWAVSTVSSVLVFPTVLEQERLEKALARAASYWPNVVGRYVKSTVGGEFAISLTNSPIPFSTQTVDAAYPYPDKNVVQPDLGEYLPQLAGDYFVAGADAALLAVRLTTLSSGGSVLGVNWAHVLGDAAAFSRFLEDVSLFYNMPYTALDNEDMPTLEPHVRLPAYTEQIGQQYALDTLNPLPLEEAMKGYSDAVAGSQQFNLILTQDEVKHITALRVAGERLSDNDLIASWWINVLERAGQPVDYLVQTINYRSFHKDHPAFPRNLSTLAANVSQMRKIPLPPRSGTATPGGRVSTIARTIRSEMNHLRSDPDHMLQFLSNAAHEVALAARTGTTPCLVPKPGGVLVNSNLRYDWAITFGQPSANYHTNTSLVRFLRVFQANPREGASAKGERDVELIFRVDAGRAAEQVSRIVDEDRARWANDPLPTAAEEQTAAPEPEVRTFGFNQTQHQAPWGGLGN